SFAVRNDRLLAQARLRQTATVAVIALAIGGWWYAYKFVAFNSITGGAEFITLDAQGGLLVNLPQKFAVRYLVRAFAALIATAYYTGTWSLTRLPEVLYLPGLLLLAFITIRALVALRPHALTDPEWAPLWLAAPVF